jgi:hypothetical protein
MIRPVILEANQKSCVDANFASCIKFGHFANGAGTGTGKTPCTIALAQQLSKHHGKPVTTCVVGPAASVRPSKSKIQTEMPLSPWERESVRYNYTECYVSTYETLRGTSEKAGKSSPAILKRVCGDFKNMTGRNLLHDAEYYLYTPEEEEAFYADIIAESNAYADNFEDYECKGVRHAWKYSTDHGLVEKLDLLNLRAYKEGKYVYDSIYSPTMAWIKYLENPDHITLVVFDEVQLARGASQQNSSCAALIRGVRRAFHKHGNAYFGSLTATPLNKPSHANNYFKLYGCCDPLGQLDMFVFTSSVASWQCYELAQHYNRTQAKTIAREFKMFDKQGKIKRTKNPRESDLIATLWIDCVLEATHSSIPDITFGVLCNGFFDITHPEDIAENAKAYRLLVKADEYRKSGNGSKALAIQNKSTRAAENGMTRKLAERAYNDYQSDPDNKIILGFNYISNVRRAYQYLLRMGIKSHEMGMISGDDEDDEDRRSAAVRQQEKERYVHHFMVRKSFRIVLVTLKACGMSISLEDRIGRRPRFAYTAMGNDFDQFAQFCGRFKRFGNQSVATIFICYPKSFGPDAMRIYANNVAMLIRV